MKRLALVLHHAGTAPNLIYPSLRTLTNVEVVTFYIKSEHNQALNAVYDEFMGTIGPAILCKNEQDMFEKVIAYHADYNFNGVLTFAEMLVNLVNKVSKHIGKSYMSDATITALQNKYLQRQILADAGVTVPRFYEIKSEADLEIAAQTVSFPAVLKPNYGGEAMEFSK